MQIIRYEDIVNVNGLMFRDWDSVALGAVLSYAYKKRVKPDAKLETPVEFVSRVLRNGRVEQSPVIDREGLERDFKFAVDGEDGWETHPNFRKPVELPPFGELVRQAEGALETARALVEAERLESEL